MESGDEKDSKNGDVELNFQKKYLNVNNEKRVQIHASRLLLLCGLIADKNKPGYFHQIGPECNHGIRQPATMGQIMNTCLSNMAT